MTVVVTACLWYEVGMTLVMSYYKFAPLLLARVPLRNLIMKFCPEISPVLLRRVMGISAAQCEIAPHIAQYPFEIVSQRGVSHPFALF